MSVIGELAIVLGEPTRSLGEIRSKQMGSLNKNVGKSD